MPYKIDPNNKKCVIKADTGKKVGCTKGSVKKYLAALHANVNESTGGKYDFLMGSDLVGSEIRANDTLMTITKISPYTSKDRVLTISSENPFYDSEDINSNKMFEADILESDLINALNNGQWTINTNQNPFETLNENRYPGIVKRFKVGDRVIVNGWYGEESPHPYDFVARFDNELGTVVDVDVAPGLSFKNGGEVIVAFDKWRLPIEGDGEDGGFSFLDECRGNKCLQFSNLMDDDYDFSIKPVSKEMDVKDFDPFETLNESEENELGWAEDIVSQPPLEFRGKEILIDIRDLNSEERENLVDILEDYMEPDDEDYGWPNDCFRQGEYRKSKVFSISLHCGIEDYDYIPKKGLICCLTTTYEEDQNKGNIIPLDGRDVLNYYKNSNINESEEDLEWAEDTVNANPTYRFGDLVFKPHHIPGAVRARLNFPNGHYISVVGGPHLYGDGVDTFEIWGSDTEDPEGYLTKADVTNRMIELQNLPPLEGNGTFKKEPITEDVEEFEWAEDALTSDIWVNWDEVNIGDYVEIKENDDIFRHKDGSMWNVIWFGNCGVYNPNDWSVRDVPCMKVQSVFDKNGVRWLSGQSVEIRKNSNIKFKIIDTREMYKERGWKPMTESEDLEWAQDAVSGLDHYVEYDGQELSNGTVLMISGEYEDLYFQDQWAKVVRREGGEVYLIVFPNYIENDETHTHCGERHSDDEYSCGCTDSDSQFGNCWYINLTELDEVKVFPNLRNFINENKSLLTEGRYDAITRKVVQDVMQVVTNTKGNEEEVVQAELPNTIRSEEYEYLQEGLGFSVELNVHHQYLYHDRNALKESDAYFVDAAIAEGDDNVIMLTVVVDPTWEPQIYEKLFYKLQEVVRHEIEHLTQSGYYRIEDRPKSTTSTAKLKTVYGHHKHKIEVPALVHGFYRRAKIEKRPIDEVMIEDLDSEIEKGNLSKKQAENLLKTWVEYAKKNLPTAIYSQE
jgi:hypothetical protein